MCQIIYPRNWTSLGPKPQIVLYANRNIEQFNFIVCKIDAPNNDVKFLSEFVEIKSSDGRFRVINFPNICETDRYSVSIINTSLGKAVGEVGFTVDDSICEEFDLSNSFDMISDVYLNASNCRFISNGIGKCGTSWLLDLLASLPGLNSFDMAANNFHGFDTNELKKIPKGTVYHGHLGYGSAAVLALREFSYCHAYIYRDLRDSIVSEYFHKFHFQRGQFHPELLAISESEMFGIDLIYKWSDVVYSAPNAVGWAKSKECSCLSYESLLLSPYDTFKKLLISFGFKTEMNLIRYIFFINRFVLQSGGREPGNFDPNSFFRKGVVGDWRNYISNQTSSQLISRNSDFFQYFGFELN